MAHLGWYSRGYLPHCDAPGALQAITFRLADSLPLEVRQRMKREIACYPEDRKVREWRSRIELWLGTGHGSCLLGKPECARVVAEAFQFFDKERYDLLAWVVMPNHVHLVIRQYENWALGGLVQSWKGFTTKKINEICGNTLYEKIWQRGFWDRFIRDEHHFEATLQYIGNNPVKAGLVSSPSEWPWLRLPGAYELPGRA